MTNWFGHRKKDERLEWLANMPLCEQNEIWRKLLERNRSERIKAYIDDPERDAWLDEIVADSIIEGAAHKGVFCSKTVYKEKD